VTTTTVTRDQAVTDRTTEANRQIAIEFLTRAARGEAREVMRRYAAPDFTHHNPYFAGDAETLAAGMDENASSNPKKAFEILRTVAEGPLVAVHSRVRLKPGDAPHALAHLFRIEDGRIRELWDIAQELPAESPNRAGMF
jgi:predicted SnoaL-like aldol condensation-catalyzing enzyme